jgi:branched-chain amino acid transport system permease protein
MRDFALAALVLAALAAAPWLADSHTLTLLARVMVFGVAAVSLALLVGGAGLVSLGHAASLGMGAYAVVVLDAARVTEAAIVLPTAMAAGAGFALLTGAVAMRTSGVHFIMITLAFGQMAFFATSALSSYGGDDGYTLYARSTFFGTRLLADATAFHHACLIALAVTWLVCRLVLSSRFGRVLRAARETPQRVEALGFAPYPYRLAAYTLAGGFAGLSGFLLANATEFVSPAFAAWQRSGELLFMVILGGGGLAGSIFGAAAFVVAEAQLSALWEHWRILFGTALVVFVLAQPAFSRRFGRG